MQWWSLAYANAGVLLNDSAMVASAVNVFDHVMRHASDNSSKACGGGVWWSDKKAYKNAVTNELVVANAAALHGATGEQRFLDLALAQWRWFRGCGMINASTGAVCDGLVIAKQPPHTCSGTGGTSYTYNQGVILGGLAALHGATGDASLLHHAHLIANATLEHVSRLEKELER